MEHLPVTGFVCTEIRDDLCPAEGGGAFRNLEMVCKATEKDASYRELSLETGTYCCSLLLETGEFSATFYRTEATGEVDFSELEGCAIQEAIVYKNGTLELLFSNLWRLTVQPTFNGCNSVAQDSEAWRLTLRYNPPHTLWDLYYLACVGRYFKVPENEMFR